MTVSTCIHGKRYICIILYTVYRYTSFSRDINNLLFMSDFGGLCFNSKSLTTHAFKKKVTLHNVES